jgi:hypothetical protein
MPRIAFPLIGPAYRSRSINVACQRAVNCYLEAGADGAPVALYGTPGTVRRATIGTGPVRAGISAGGYTWWVSGSQVYRMDPNFSTTLCGSISNSSGPAGMAANEFQVLIVDGISGWLVDLTTATLMEITDPDFPAGVTRAAYQDGYFIVAGDGSGRFYINELPNDGRSWNGTDFASAEGAPDSLVAIISDHRELWLIGADSAEVWVNTGNADFPFERSGNVFIENGIASAGSLAKMDNTVFWIGSDPRGHGIVWRANGYTPARISNHGIEYALSTYSTISDAIGWTYTSGGHSFYVIQFPTAGKTWVYDAATNEWHERAWWNTSTGEFEQWRASCHVFANGMHLVGDREDGRVYSLEDAVNTDDGGILKRLRTTQNSNDRQLLQFYTMLQIVMETGHDATPEARLMLRWSNDAGHTWSNTVTAHVGAVGQYSARVMFTRLGSGRNRVWEISLTDPVPFAVTGSILEGVSGNA